MTLKAIKAAATKQEKARVYENMNTPRDIIVQFEGTTYIRRAWSCVGNFGWEPWEVVA